MAMHSSLAADHGHNVIPKKRITITIDEIFERKYETLCNIAQRHIAKWKSTSYLEVKSLVNEVYLKLRQQRSSGWENTAHFQRLASNAMYHILLNNKEYWQAKKRGGQYKHVSIDNGGPNLELLQSEPEKHLLLSLSIDKALKKLEGISQRKAEIVRYRFLMDMSVEETAQMLNISTATVKREWAFSKAWLYRELNTEKE